MPHNLSQKARDERRWPDKLVDNRSPAQRDRDRVMYATAFRRLGGVTQVALTKDDGHLLHTRLTHSIKVAQVGTRIAQMLLASLADLDADSRRAYLRGGGLDPDVVEAACLAHDLGHPPFGHIAEHELHLAASKHGVDDGFEGNAQTFRILTFLAQALPSHNGLNLTRATLNAVAKYPWTWADRLPGQKWGTFDSELEDLKWARRGLSIAARERTIEAEIMDWADDVAYAVHDLEDFYRADFIPLDTLAGNPAAMEPLYERAAIRWWSETWGTKPSTDELTQAYVAAIESFPLRRRFSGTRLERNALRDYMSTLVGRYVRATALGPAGLAIERQARVEVALLKELTRTYVVENPALATVQYGQRQIIRTLFDIYFAALDPNSPDPDIFPARVRDEARKMAETNAKTPARARFVADTIASMTDAHAIKVHHRLTGWDPGGLADLT
jgi:dGTPase